MLTKEKTTIVLDSGSTVDTDSPIIYSGNFLLITEKNKSEFGGLFTITSTITPINLATVKKIITNHITQKYPQYEEK